MNLVERMKELLAQFQNDETVANLRQVVEFWNQNYDELAQANEFQTLGEQVSAAYSKKEAVIGNSIEAGLNRIEQAFYHIKDRESYIKAVEVWNRETPGIYSNLNSKPYKQYKEKYESLKNDINQIYNNAKETGKFEYLTTDQENAMFHNIPTPEMPKKKIKLPKALAAALAAAGVVVTYIAGRNDIFGKIGDLFNNTRNNSITKTVDIVQASDMKEVSENLIAVSNDEAVVNNLSAILNDGGPYGLEVSAEQIFDTWLLSNYEAVMKNAPYDNTEYLERLNYLEVSGNGLINNQLHVFTNMAMSVPEIIKDGGTTHYADIFKASEERYEKAREFENLLNQVVRAAYDGDKEKFNTLNEQLKNTLNDSYMADTQLDPSLSLWALKLVDMSDAVIRNMGYPMLNEVEQHALMDASDNCANALSGQFHDEVDQAYTSSPAEDLKDGLLRNPHKVEGQYTRDEIVEMIKGLMKTDTYQTREEITGVDLSDVDARVTFDENGKGTIVVGGFPGGAVPGSSGGQKEGTTTTVTTTVIPETIDENAPKDVVISETEEKVEIPDHVEVVEETGSTPQHPIYDPSVDNVSPEEQPGKEEYTGKYYDPWGNVYSSAEERDQAVRDYYANHQDELANQESVGAPAVEEVTPTPEATPAPTPEPTPEAVPSTPTDTVISEEVVDAPITFVEEVIPTAAPEAKVEESVATPAPVVETAEPAPAVEAPVETVQAVEAPVEVSAPVVEQTSPSPEIVRAATEAVLNEVAQESLNPTVIAEEETVGYTK